MEIRALNSEDIASILLLEKDHAPDIPFYAKYNHEALAFIFDNADSCHAVGLFDDKKLVGWGGYRTNWSKDNLTVGIYEISSIVLHKDYRGKGNGKDILLNLIGTIKKNQQYKKIYLTVSPLNIGALILYLKNNFVIYDFKKNVYGEGADRLYLELKEEV